MSDTTNDSMIATTIGSRPGKRRFGPIAWCGLWSLPVRLVAIAMLAGATLVPIARVSSLVGERESRETDVQRAITRSWGPAQIVESPTLSIPVSDTNGAMRFLKVAPKILAIKAALTPERRHRGIFAATVYTAAIEVSGTFTLPPAAQLASQAGAGRPELAHSLITLPVAGLDGVESGDAVHAAGTRTPWQLCVDRLAPTACRDSTVLVAPVDAASAKNGEIAFTATLHLRGTEALNLALAGKEVTATITGAWPTPSFGGALLPTETKSDGEVFEARWRHDEIGRPRLTTGDRIVDGSAGSVTIGVDLIEATPVYRMIERTSKYALLVIVLAFTTYFLVELVAGIRLTLLHYALLGASLSLFTLLLLSVSELIGYPAGYTLSAALVVAQASLYTASVTRRRWPALVFAATLTGKFGLLYVLLGLESYALVLGTAALFILLSVVMAATQSLAPATAPWPARWQSNHAAAPPLLPQAGEG